MPRDDDPQVRRLERKARLKHAASQRSGGGRSSRGGASTWGDNTDTYVGTSGGGSSGGGRRGSRSGSAGGGGGSVRSSGGGSRVGSNMLAQRHKRLRWRTVLRQRLSQRHLWLSIVSKRSSPFYSRAQQATVRHGHPCSPSAATEMMELLSDLPGISSLCCGRCC